MPPYFKQNHQSACSLAAFRSVLAQRGLEVSEDELIAKIEPDYGKSFKNIWNPTIAKLAREYGIDTAMYADWPLFRPNLLEQALDEFRKNPETMDIQKYENPDDYDTIPAPLPLAYKEMFQAIELGCKTVYGGLTAERLRDFLDAGFWVQTSIKTKILYSGERDAYHSILIYDLAGDGVVYHDPARSPAMSCSVNTLLRAANGTGACLVYNLKDV